MSTFRTNWDARALRVAGPDATDFLHRLSTAHVKKLKGSHSVPALFLTGTSLLIASFQLYRESAESFVLVADAAEFPALTSHLERMHFSENLERTELETRAWKFAGADAGAVKDALEGVALVWKLGKGDLAAAAVFGENASRFERPDFAPEKNDSDFWEEKRIRARVPSFGKEWNLESRALDVGFLDWIDRNKGCYPGQEVVEKSLNLGHPARALALVAGKVLPAGLPAELFRDGKTAGQLTSAAGGFGLAVVKWDHREAGTKFTTAESAGELIVEKEES